MTKWFSASKKKNAAAKKLMSDHFNFSCDSIKRRFRSMTWSTIGEGVDSGDDKEIGIS